MATLMMSRYYKSAAFLLILCTAGAAWIDAARYVPGVLAGGILGIVNIRGLSKGVASIVGMHENPSKIKLFFHGIFRLFLLSGVIILLAVTRAVDLLALLAGFTAVTLVLLIEGLRVAVFFTPESEGV